MNMKTQYIILALATTADASSKSSSQPLVLLPNFDIGYYEQNDHIDVHGMSMHVGTVLGDVSSPANKIVGSEKKDIREVVLNYSGYKYKENTWISIREGGIIDYAERSVVTFDISQLREIPNRYSIDAYLVVPIITGTCRSLQRDCHGTSRTIAILGEEYKTPENKEIQIRVDGWYGDQLSQLTEQMWEPGFPVPDIFLGTMSVAVPYIDMTTHPIEYSLPINLENILQRDSTATMLTLLFSALEHERKCDRGSKREGKILFLYYDAVCLQTEHRDVGLGTLESGNPVRLEISLRETRLWE